MLLTKFEQMAFSIDYIEIGDLITIGNRIQINFSYLLYDTAMMRNHAQNYVCLYPGSI